MINSSNSECDVGILLYKRKKLFLVLASQKTEKNPTRSTIINLKLWSHNNNFEEILF
jgi:hypothetical protein